MKKAARYIGLALGFGGAVSAYFVEGDLWLYAVAAALLGSVVTSGVNLAERKRVAALASLLPIGIAAFYLVINPVNFTFEGGRLSIQETCMVRQYQEYGEATTFQKKCSELTNADIYWEAKVEYGERYYYEGKGAPPQTFNGCRIGLTRDAIGDPDKTVYVAKPCEQVTSEDAQRAGVGASGSYYTWQWD